MVKLTIKYSSRRSSDYELTDEAYLQFVQKLPEVGGWMPFDDKAGSSHLINTREVEEIGVTYIAYESN